MNFFIEKTNFHSLFVKENIFPTFRKCTQVGNLTCKGPFGCKEGRENCSFTNLNWRTVFFMQRGREGILDQLQFMGNKSKRWSILIRNGSHCADKFCCIMEIQLIDILGATCIVLALEYDPILAQV